MEVRQPITRPGRGGSHDQAAKQYQATVIVDAPACKILPGFFTIRLERKACRVKLIQHRVKFGPLHANGSLREVRVLRIRDIEIIRDAAKRKEACTYAQRG